MTDHHMHDNSVEAYIEELNLGHLAKRNSLIVHVYARSAEPLTDWEVAERLGLG